MIRIFIAENVPSLNKGEMAIMEGMLESFKTLGEVQVAMLSDLPHIDKTRYKTNIKIFDIKKILLLNHKLDYYHLSTSNYLSLSSLFFIIKVFLLFIYQHLLFITLYKILGSKSFVLFKSEIWREYAESDVIIIGHDGTFGIMGGTLGVPIFLYHIFMPLFAKMLGKPIVLYAGSIPQYYNRYKVFAHSHSIRWLLEKVTRTSLNMMDLITVRDRISYQYFKGTGLQGYKVFLTADPSFLVKPASLKRVEVIMRREGIVKSTGPLIGMTVTREIANKLYQDLEYSRNSYRKHIIMLSQIIDYLTSKLGAIVIILPHCIGYGKKNDDRIINADIFQLCENKDRVKLILDEYGPGELKGIIGQCDLFIGERIHSVIAAMSMFVPSIVISYSSDYRLDIIEMLDQKYAICHVENLDTNSFISRVNEIWLQRENIRMNLRTKIDKIKECAKLNGKLLKAFLDVRKIDTHRPRTI